MSRKRYECCMKEKNTFFGGMGNCCCDFSSLVILILIILQFNRHGNWFGVGNLGAEGVEEACDHEHKPFVGGFKLIDNSILFIIALFFLSCCNTCKEY